MFGDGAEAAAVTTGGRLSRGNSGLCVKSYFQIHLPELDAVAWTAFPAFAFNIIVCSLCFFIVRPFYLVRMPTTTHRWYDLVLRAAMVAMLVGMVLSFRIGPTESGVLAVFPIIHTRIYPLTPSNV